MLLLLKSLRLAFKAEMRGIFSESLTLITSQFLHGGFLHIAGNMLFLWVFGANIEERQVQIRSIIFYLTCGTLAALAQALCSFVARINPKIDEISY